METSIRNMRNGTVAVNISLLFLFFVGVGIFLILTPGYADDYEYMMRLEPWFEKQGVTLPQDGGNIFKYGIPFQEIKETWEWRNLHDNRRLANILVMFFLLIPKWVGSGLALICWMYSAVISLRFVSSDVCKSSIVPVSIFCWVFMMPWSDFMGTLDYQFNYVIGTALTLLLIHYVRLSVKDRDRNHRGFQGIMREIGIVVLSVSVGAWNEGFSIPLLCGLLALTILFPSRCRNKVILLSIAGLVIGLMWLVTSPAFGRRVDHEFFSHGLDFKFIIKDVLMFHSSVAIFFLLMITAFFVRGRKLIFSDAGILFVAVSSLVSLSMSIFTSGSPRSGWWGNFASIVGILILLYEMVPHFRNGYRPTTGIIGLVCIIFSGFVVLPVDIYVVRQSREYRSLILKWLQNPGRVLYGDVECEYSYPCLSRLWLSQRIFWEWHPSKNKYYFGKEAYNYPMWSVVPQLLQDFSPEDGERISGDAEVYHIGDWFVKRTGEICPRLGVADIRYGNQLKEDIPLVIIPFRSSKDGLNYMLIIPYDRWWEYKLLGVSEINNLRLSDDPHNPYLLITNE